ncbi:phage portal protein [Bacillus vallismortis]|uniref:XkdQ/YqbQ family protein n=1 Tax=Bacillus vallismortis TaxID=72361 RepID=UPI0011E98F3E|nr:MULTISPECIES: phage portal protein [Bacillus subtilis group]MCY7919823.1 phage portal protein [Bacillus vallismortis]MCY8308095.1 phage portal protein [Bacillus vallismortis]MCY8535456.1 phage portal protein [Bacillus vallismortis]MCY8596830.1 phage portal protein [Bacillus vallismortis]TYS08380.1 phage portal protein [Bacillus subtilis]
MIELFVIKDTEWLELVAESVSLEGHRYQAPRSIEATIVIKQGDQTYYSVTEGDTVLFKWKGKELFRGIVFARTPDEHTLAFSAYDMLQYLVKNQDVYVFSNQRADQMIRRIANDFQIPTTSIANTGHTIKSLVIKNDTTLYDIILKALKQTKSQTGRHYQLYSEKGKLGLRAWPDPSEVWVLETGVNITGYQYSTSINDTATRVVLRRQKDNKTYKASAKDSSGVNKYGVLQYTETVTDDINKAQLQQRADVRLAEKKGVKKELKNIQAVGIPEVRSGLPVYISIPEAGIKKTYWVDTDRHEFKGTKHTMTIDVVEKNTMPEGVS